MKHLLSHWRDIKNALGRKYIMLFLDYDGTLAPIADVPGKASLPRETKDLLRQLSRIPGLKIAVVSGRALSNIKAMVGLKGIIYAGNHGLELEGPKIKHEGFVPQRYLTTLARVKKELQSKIAHVKGAFIEDKGYALALHYRLVDGPKRAIAKTLFHETIIIPLVQGIIRINAGKMVWEVLPPVVWNKGKIVLWLLARQRFAGGSHRPLPIYVGDNTTDEDAFKALKKKGLTMLVGKPRSSHATYYLKDTGEVAKFLRLVLQLKSVAV